MKRYLGNKYSLTDWIYEVIQTQTESVHSALDVFAGTASVSKCLKEHGMSVMANDAQYYSYVQARTLMEMDHPISTELRERIEFLNSDALIVSPPCEIEQAFIYQNYSPHDGCGRMYFTRDNALRIDYIRHQIELWYGKQWEEDFYYLLALLLDAASIVANTTGTFGAYLKNFTRSASRPLVLKETDIVIGNAPCQAFCMDVQEFATKVRADIAYLDPPYCGRKYNKCYHVLETIARYDCPEIKGETGQRVESGTKSDFCSKKTARQAFEQLLGKLDVRYILLSYNDDKTSILTTEEMSEVVRSCGKPETFRLLEKPYDRFNSNQKGAKKTINEQLYFIEKEI